MQAAQEGFQGCNAESLSGCDGEKVDQEVVGRCFLCHYFVSQGVQDASVGFGIDGSPCGFDCACEFLLPVYAALLGGEDACDGELVQLRSRLGGGHGS